MRHAFGVLSLVVAAVLVLQSVSMAAAPSPDDGIQFQPDAAITGIAVQPDGRIIIGGRFLTLNQQPCRYLVRLHPDGTIDPSFNIGTGPNSDVLAIALQPDGKLIVGGYFSSINGVARICLARLNLDGSLDMTFNCNIHTNVRIDCLAIQPNGKILVGGKLGSAVSSSLIRLNQDGSSDDTFNQVYFYPNHDFSYLNAVAIAPGGKIYVGGEFSQINGINRMRIARLNVDGTLDKSFDPRTEPENMVLAMTLQKDGKILAAGWYGSRILRYDLNGSLDAEFQSIEPINNYAGSLAIQPDGKILVGCEHSFVRINMDGSLDSTFQSKISGAGHITLQADGKILVSNGVRLNHDGSLDTTFNCGTGADFDIHWVARQTDGKIVIAGDFDHINAVSRNGIARINVDGSLDESFAPDIPATHSITAMILLNNRKILLSRSYPYGDYETYNEVLRLQEDGSIDPEFHPYAMIGFYDQVKSLGELPNGKIVVSGSFLVSDGKSYPNILRLNSDGSLDSTYVPYPDPDSSFDSVKVQPDGKILIGGSFTNEFGQQGDSIKRLKPDGSIDITFKSAMAQAGYVNDLALQPDGKVLVTGHESPLHPYYVKCFVRRLNTDGSLDPEFNSSLKANELSDVISLQSDGRIVCGSCRLLNPITKDYLYYINRITTNGLPDDSFTTCTLTNGHASSFIILPDGKILVAGGFTAVNGVSSRKIARLNADGSLDISFNAFGTGANGQAGALAVQLDCNVLIGGEFTSINSATCNRIARLSREDGRLDTTLNTGPGANGSVNAIATLSSGKIVLGGAFTSISGRTANHLARLNANGSVDTNFALSGANDQVIAIAPCGDTLFVAGNYTSVGGKTCNRIAQLSADGVVVNSFGSGANADVDCVAIQPDGKIVLGGNFTVVRANPRNRIARLNASGLIDSTFAPAGANGAVLAVLVQPDGKILMGGEFTTANGDTINRIARLNPDGSRDTLFNPGSGANGAVVSMALQADGRIQIAGKFTTFDGVNRSHIARLNADGSLDTSYDPGLGADNNVLGVALQYDGKSLVCGDFTSIKGYARRYFARLSNPDAAMQRILVDRFGSPTWSLGGSSPQPYQVIFELSTDGIVWNSIGWGTPVPGVGFRLANPNMPVTTNQYVRATGWVSGGRYNGSVSLIRSPVYFTETSRLNATQNWLAYR